MDLIGSEPFNYIRQRIVLKMYAAGVNEVDKRRPEDQLGYYGAACSIRWLHETLFWLNPLTGIAGGYGGPVGNWIRMRTKNRALLRSGTCTDWRLKEKALPYARHAHSARTLCFCTFNVPMAGIQEQTVTQSSKGDFGPVWLCRLMVRDPNVTLQYILTEPPPAAFKAGIAGGFELLLYLMKYCWPRQPSRLSIDDSVRRSFGLSGRTVVAVDGNGTVQMIKSNLTHF